MILKIEIFLLLASLAFMVIGVNEADPDSTNKTQAYLLLAIWFALLAQLVDRKKKD